MTGAGGSKRLLASEIAHTLHPGGLQIQRSPADQKEPDAQSRTAAEGDPVELPEHSPEVDQLAVNTAQRINDVIERDWENDLQSGLQALLTATEIERILAKVFEMGHGSQPQLGKSNAPVLQYYVSQHPQLRERLTVLRQLAGPPSNTARIGRYLDIPVGAADAYTYEISLTGISGGEGVEAMRQIVLIRYLEDGEQKWRRAYDYIAGGGGVGGPLPVVVGSDIFWNDFSTNEYWAPEDFAGPMTIAGVGGGVIIGWEWEAATFSGNGKHSPVEADIGGIMLTSAAIGFGAFTGALMPWRGIAAPAPPPSKGVLPPPPPFVRRPDVSDQITLEFSTGQSNLNQKAYDYLDRFIARWRDVFDGGMFRLQLIGYASRTGSATTNQRLSEDRVQSVRDAIESTPMLGDELDEDHMSTIAVGEDVARLEGRDPDDDSASDRVVEVSLLGQRTVPVDQEK